ncbi:class 3 lipase, partial [Angomonas deanei]
MDYGEPGQLLRNYHYTHHQPQWGRTLESLSSPTPDGHLVLRRRALAAERMCTLCHFTKAACVCRKCCVCEAAVGLGTRHHCRKCWRPVCSGCWTQMRHLYLAPEKTMKLCDPCATPWALANLSKREENGLYWGLYLLRRAGEMPCLCVNPSCSTFTYLPNCYKCHSPTVMTQPHVERLVRIQADVANMTDATMILDRQMLSQRFLLVGEYAPEVVQTTFRSCFKHMEELLAFRSVSCPLQGQDILLAMVAASVSYEYNNAPNITLALSDVPYAKLLRVHTCSARYSILEAPGKVKFISFPGTHNWRTRWVDMQFSQTTVQVWSDVVEGVTADGRQLHGGRRKVWEYKIHSGFDQEAKEVGLSLQSLIDDIRNGYRLVLSGHSLGGVVAQHITLQLLNLHPELFLHTDKSCPPPLSCVTLGSPLLGNYQLVDAVVR